MERLAMATVRLIMGVAVMLLGVSAMQAAWAEGPTAGNAADATGIIVPMTSAKPKRPSAAATL